MEYAKKELKLVFLELNWVDIIPYVIKEEDLVQCVRFIHQARSSGGSVLVHCAQVKHSQYISKLMNTCRHRKFKRSPNP